MKFSRKFDNGSVNKRLNFCLDPDHRLDTGIVFRIRHYWDIRKLVNGHGIFHGLQSAESSGWIECFTWCSRTRYMTRYDINLRLILIRQMVALVRCALAEVWTVPVLLPVLLINFDLRLVQVASTVSGNIAVIHFLFQPGGVAMILLWGTKDRVWGRKSPSGVWCQSNGWIWGKALEARNNSRK